MEKGRIVEQALTRIGSNTYYNDNSSDIFKEASKILDQITRNICKSNDFRFPSLTETLTQAGVNEATGEYKYNIPTGFLGVSQQPRLIRPVGYRVQSIKQLTNMGFAQNFRVEGEYIYSTEKPLKLSYVRNITLSEFPDYMEEYVILSLALKLAIAFPSYRDFIGLIKSELEVERINTQLCEGSGQSRYSLQNKEVR